ncbi:MAG: tetratricopeptide repeat protein [Candidatus Kapaibacterium sp.]
MAEVKKVIKRDIEGLSVSKESDKKKDELGRLATCMNICRNKEYSTTVFIGSGVSKTAGIPTASEIMDDLDKREHFKNLVKQAKHRTFTEYMKCLESDQRKDLFIEYIDKAKVNIAHIYLASLVKAGYVDYIVTTNFDPLAVMALSLFNIFPAIYDIANAKDFEPGVFVTPSVIYLHGQSYGFWQMNTPDELSLPLNTIETALIDINQKSLWIIVGYSGDDPVLGKLAKIRKFSHGLYWICYKDNDPKEKVQRELLKDKTRGTHIIKGYDSDSFFHSLYNELNVEPPNIVSKPFTNLSDIYSMIQDKGEIDGKPIDLIGSANLWIKDAIKVFEDKIPCEETDTFKNKKKFEEENLISDIKDIWINQEYENIDSYYEKVISSQLSDAKLYLSYGYEGRGSEYYYSKSYEKAIADYTKAIELKPDDADAYWSRGNAYYYLQKYDEAIADYTKAIELKPDDADAYNNRGIAYRKLEKYDEAIADFSKAIELKPDYALAYYNRGVAYYDLKKYEEVIADYTKAIELEPDFADAYINRGSAFSCLEEYDKSIADNSKAIELKPDYVGAKLNLIEAYIMYGSYREAQKKLDIAKKLKLNLKDSLLLAFLNCLVLRLNEEDTSDAEIELEKLLKEEIKITWSFEELETWLGKTKISDNKKKEYVKGLIEKMKAKKNSPKDTE